jgi:hypothetical protein
MRDGTFSFQGGTRSSRRPMDFRKWQNGRAYPREIEAAECFEVSAWPYSDLDVALGEEAPAGSAADEPDTLGIVRAYRDDMFEMTFVKNGIGYVVQTVPENATSTINILKSWHFI